MTKKDYFKFENISKAVARIPIVQIHILFLFGFFGACLFVVGLFTGYGRLDSDIEHIPEYAIFMFIGWVCFSFFFPLSYIFYLFKEIQMLKDKLEDIDKNKPTTSTTSANSPIKQNNI